jgi:hypothetical protein
MVDKIRGRLRLDWEGFQRLPKLMAWTKNQTAIVAGVIILLAIITAFVMMDNQPKVSHPNLAQQPPSPPPPPPPATGAPLVERIQQENAGLPDPQVQAKTLIFSAIIQKRIPAAANWCETLNAGGKLWPTTPTNTVFVLNSQMADRAYSRKLPGSVVVFFEADHAGWNLAGGPELLARKPEGVAVAFADGRSLIIPPGEIPNLRWSP